MARRPLAPAPAVMWKERMPADQLRALKLELPRPSSQVSSWRPETIGTPRACAETRMASDKRGID